MYRIVAGPGSVRDSITRGAHGWRSMTPRAAITCRRIAVFQSVSVRDDVDLADDDIDDPIEDVVLVLDMVVQRHRIDPEFLAELAHAHGLTAASIGELDGGPQHPLLAQREAGRRAPIGLGHHLVPLTTITLAYGVSLPRRRASLDKSTV